MYRIILIIGLSLFLPKDAPARQVEGFPGNAGRDSIKHILLPEVQVVGKVRGKRFYARARERDARLRHNVRKAYPYAREAARRIEQIEARLASVTGGKERKEIVAAEYKNLMRTFKEPLMKLTITQGRILVRLVFRETQKSSFHHVKEYRGSVNAYFWQSLALLFGNNLKAGYDPDGDDREIEEIVQEIEREGMP
jgi:hypothetical protein